MNHAIGNRLLSTLEAEAIRKQYFAGGSSLNRMSRQLHLARQTLLDIIYQRGAYTKLNDSAHNLYMSGGYGYPPHLKERRDQIVPNIRWPD